MDKVELYRRVFTSFRELCAIGQQPCSFRAYCTEHGVDCKLMSNLLKGEFQNVTTLPGYERLQSNGIANLCQQVYDEFKALCASGKQPDSFGLFCQSRGISCKQMYDYLRRNKLKLAGLPGYERLQSNGIASLCQRIYDEFKALCASGKQPDSFGLFCQSRGISRSQMKDFLYRNKLRLIGLPGYERYFGTNRRAAAEVPFEDVIFEEAGFLPAGGSASITVKVDERIAVSFPADTDVADIARFIRKMGKEASHVGS